MQTRSSETLIGWKSGQTTYVPLWERMEGARLWTPLGNGTSSLNLRPECSNNFMFVYCNKRHFYYIITVFVFTEGGAMYLSTFKMFFVYIIRYTATSHLRQ
jgi:hypothetical protein